MDNKLKSNGRKLIIKSWFCMLLLPFICWSQENSDQNRGVDCQYQLTSVNGAQQYWQNSSVQILWDSSGIECSNEVSIELWKSGVHDSIISPMTTNDGYYNWNIPSIQTPGNDYIIRIKDGVNANIYDDTDMFFSIIDANECLYKMIIPNGGQEFVIGQETLILWSPFGFDCGDTFNIDLYKDESFYSAIASGITGSSLDWTVELLQSQDQGSDFKFVVSNASNSEQFDASDSNNSIFEGFCDYQVISPNGGESWRQGETATFEWGAIGSDCSNEAEILLMKNGEIIDSLVTINNGNGIYQWSIPSDQLIGSDYQFKVQDDQNTEYSDVSDGYFSIDEISICVYELTDPNGGESWEQGEMAQISWNFRGLDCGTDVIIQILDFSQVVMVISELIENDGNLQWLVPLNLSVGSSYRIKIVDFGNTDYVDVSDSFFDVTPEINCDIDITTPNGNEILTQGTQIEIDWLRQGNDCVSPVSLDLLQNDVYVSTITNSTNNDGGFFWNIPPSDDFGGDFKVSIISNNEPYYYDESDQSFFIVPDLIYKNSFE